MRSFLIYLSKAAWARKIVTGWGVAWRVASRFIAGDTLDDAIRVVRGLNEKGINATLDQLGENTTNLEEAARAKQGILTMIQEIARMGVRSGVSIKLSQIGLTIDHGGCTENLAEILTEAQKFGIFVRIDMEDSPWTEITLKLFRQMRLERGFENTGIVIQSYLYRSEEDIRVLAIEGSKVRLCKGAYKEPPEIAFPDKKDVDECYDKLAELLIDAAQAHGTPTVSPDGKAPPIPAIASHDEVRIENARKYAEKVGLPKGAIEFQMLHGIRRELQERLAAQGYPVR
ncbi:MAG: proline dehydrogenase, partial [Chloroflexi bacterium]